jgi:hypothetical protein
VAVLEELAPGRTLVRIVGGTHDGQHVVVMGDCRHASIRALAWYLDGDEPLDQSRLQTPEANAHARANELLELLLSPEELRDWRRDGHFWVSTPQGDVRLGQLYRLQFRPRHGGDRLVLCVVPNESRRAPMPEPDVWANLLLVLRTDPERFFEVANWRFARSGPWRPGPAPVCAP